MNLPKSAKQTSQYTHKTEDITFTFFDTPHITYCVLDIGHSQTITRSKAYGSHAETLALFNALKENEITKNYDFDKHLTGHAAIKQILHVVGSQYKKYHRLYLPQGLSAAQIKKVTLRRSNTHSTLLMTESQLAIIKDHAKRLCEDGYAHFLFRDFGTIFTENTKWYYNSPLYVTTFYIEANENTHMCYTQ